MLVYLDTSALAKWYINEARSEDFSAWIRTQQDTHISSLTALELRCLLARRKRMGDISPDLEQHLFSVFQEDVRVGHLVQSPVENANIAEAIQLMERTFPVPLRTLDAIHLSIAMTIGGEALATADHTMAAAAHEIDLHVFDFGN